MPKSQMAGAMGITCATTDPARSAIRNEEAISHAGLEHSTSLEKAKSTVPPALVNDDKNSKCNSEVPVKSVKEISGEKNTKLLSLPAR